MRAGRGRWCRRCSATSAPSARRSAELTRCSHSWSIGSPPVLLDAVGDVGKVRSPPPMSSTTPRRSWRVADVDLLDQLEAGCASRARRSGRRVLDVRFDPRLHQRLDRGDEQVDDGLLAAAEAGAVAAREGEVVVLVEQDGLERADALLEVVDADVLLGRVRAGRARNPSSRSSRWTPAVCGTGAGRRRRRRRRTPCSPCRCRG